MSDRRRRPFVPCLALVASLVLAPALLAEELDGAAALDHPCGRLSVEHMGLVHDGKVEESVKLATESMREEWKALPDEDRQLMSEMMQALSMEPEAYEAAVREHGTLAIDGAKATLTVVFVEESSQGTSRQTITQRFELDGEACRISR